MERYMSIFGCGLFISGLIHLAASSSSGTVISPAMTLSSTPASLSSSTDDNSGRGHSLHMSDISTQIDNHVSTSATDSDGTSLVTQGETRGINPVSSTPFRVPDFTSTTSRSRSIQTSSAHFTSDQPSRTSLTPSMTVRHTSDQVSQDISFTTKATPLFATQLLLSASSLDGLSSSMNSPMLTLSTTSTLPSVSSFTREEETSAPSSHTTRLPGTDQVSEDYSTTPRTHWPVSSPLDNIQQTDASLVDNSVTISRASINVQSSEFGHTTKLALSSTPEHSTNFIQQTSTLPSPTAILQSLNSAQESDPFVSSPVLQLSTSRQLSTGASLEHSISGSENFPTVLPVMSSVLETQQISSFHFQTSESVQPTKSNSDHFETLHSSSDTQITVNSQSIMTSAPSRDTTPLIETTPLLAVTSTASAIYSISSIKEIIPSSILNNEASMLSGLTPPSRMTVRTVTEMSQFSSSIGDIWTSLSDDMASSVVSGSSQMSPHATQQSSHSLHLDTSTQAFSGLDTSGMLYSFAIQSSPSVSSPEIPASSDFSTVMSSLSIQLSSLCIQCSTFSPIDLNSTRTDPSHSSMSESILQNQTKSLLYSSAGLSLHTSEVSRLSTLIISMVNDSSLDLLSTGGSNDSVFTPSTLGSISSPQSPLDVSPTSIDFTSFIIYHNMSTPVLTTSTPPSNNIKNLTLVFSLKGNCDFIMRNQYVLRKFWRSLLLYTEKASNLSIAQHDISLVETRCDPFRAVISISTDNDTVNIAETISNYFHSNSSHSKFFLQLNNGTKIVVIITQYQFIPTITIGSKSEDETPLSEIVVITTASAICGILIVLGLIIFIREYLQKRKSEGFRFPAESCPERVALRSLPRTSDVHGSSLEMKDAGSMSGAYNGPYESEYSTVGSQKGRKTDFMTRSDMSLSGRSKKKGRKDLSTGHAPLTSSNGTARYQDTRGYGLVIGLLGYKHRSKEPADTYAVPSKKNKVQGLSIRSTEESNSSIEMPTLPREKSRCPGGEPDGSPVPPPRHLRSVPKHNEATESIERLVASGTTRDDQKSEGVVNLAYTDDDKKDDFIGSTPSVHL